MQSDLITVQVPVGQLSHGNPYIRGRNGHFEITALRIRQWAEDHPLGDGCVALEGVGKRGKAIRGGLR